MSQTLSWKLRRHYIILFGHLTLLREKSVASTLLVLCGVFALYLLSLTRHTILKPQRLSWLPITNVCFFLILHIGAQVLWICSKLQAGHWSAAHDFPFCDPGCQKQPVSGTWLSPKERIMSNKIGQSLWWLLRLLVDGLSVKFIHLSLIKSKETEAKRILCLWKGEDSN